MRPWMLLLSLLVSDLNPLGDEDGVMEKWTLCRNLILNGRMIPTGAETLQKQTGHCCWCLKMDCLFVCVLHKRRTPPLYPDYEGYDNHGRSLSLEELMGINRSHSAVLVVPLHLQTLHQLLEISGGEAARIPMKMIKDLPCSGPAWFLHHLSTASGCSTRPSLAEESESWRPAIVVWLRKVLTERYGAAETELTSCCFQESGVKQALSIRKMSKRGILLRQGEGKKQEMGFSNQYDTFKAASVRPLDESLQQKRRNAPRVKKKNEYLSFLLRKSLQKQHPVKAPSVHDDDDYDGFYVKGKLLSAPTEEPESINKPQYKIRATPDDNKEDFVGKIITKQGELRRPWGESATERSHIGKGNRLTYKLEAHKPDNNDDKQMLSEVGDDILIMFFLTDTQTARKHILDADIKWKTVPIKELHDPPPLCKVMEGNFIMKAHNSKCKHLKEMLFLLGIYAAGEDIKSGKVTRKSAKIEKQVKGTREKIEHGETNNTRHGNMTINHTKQDAPSEESLIPSPPSVKMTELEAAKRERTAETNKVNMEIKETTSRKGVFNRSEDQDGQPRGTTQSPDCETDTDQRGIRCRRTNYVQETTKKSYSGLRMREKFSVKLLRCKEKKRVEMKRLESGEDDQNEPTEDSYTSEQTLQTTTKQAAEHPLRTHDNMPPCRGLIHRTEAGWKHCLQRHSNMSPSGEPMGAFKEREEPQRGGASIREHKDTDDDEYHHFYYFDGVLKRVQNNFHPSYERQRLRRRRRDNTKTNVFTERGGEEEETYGNLLAYIRRLSSRKEDRDDQKRRI